MSAFIKFRGISSASLGVYVTDYPPIVVPAERAKYETVPGRSGSLTMLEGDEVFDDVTISVGCAVKNLNNLSQITAWLKGGGNLEIGNRPGGHYEARVANQIPIEQILRGRAHRAFAAVFRCKPYWYHDGVANITLAAPGNVLNPGNAASRPKIRVNGTGDITLMIGGESIYLTGISSYIIIDSALTEAYRGTALANDKMDGDFPTLAPGSTPVSWSGNVTSVVITPNWRDL